MKPQILFVDDRAARIEKARNLYQSDYDFTFVCTVQDALRMLSSRDWDVVSLDHDMNGHDFQEPEETTSGMAIIRYVEKTGWPPQRKKPEFWIHTTNQLAGHLMVVCLTELGFDAFYKPFGFKKFQKGVVAGAFSVMHPGYVKLLKEAKDMCHEVIVLLHDKPNQAMDALERSEILLALKDVDQVYIYQTEKELDDLLEDIQPDIRILGSDHEGATTRPKWPTYYHKRAHDWSATELKKRFAKEVQG